MSTTTTSFANTPRPPYYAVIFSSQRSEGERGYGQMAQRMMEVAARQPGFLGVESVRGTDGFGITVSYWASEEAISAWKRHFEHKPAQEAGRRMWYADYQLRVAKVERAYGKQSSPTDRTDLQIKLDDLTGAEIAELLKEHLRSLAALSPAESMHALNLDELRKSEVTFWSAWRDGKLAGCGALKELDSKHGEIKSMRTAREHLRQGVAASILAEIIAEARRRSYARLSLETGSSGDFAPAHNLYRKFGFSECAPFAPYVPDPNSLFMTLELDRGKASLTEKFALIREHWRPKVVAQLNGQELKLVKFLGAFPWHRHENEDELFLVWRGEIDVEFRDRSVHLQPGDFCMVRRGAEHRTIANEEAEVLIFEPAQTRNTGNIVDEVFTAPDSVGI